MFEGVGVNVGAMLRKGVLLRVLGASELCLRGALGGVAATGGRCLEEVRGRASMAC